MNRNTMIAIISGCLCIAAIEIVAIMNGINGTALSAAMAAIGALAGGGTLYQIGKKKGEQGKK